MRSWLNDSRRGACGPAILAATLSITACAAAGDLKLDLAQPVPVAEYRAKLAALKRCEPGAMSIAYAFGEVELTAVRKAAACTIQIAVTGELTEGAGPQSFTCTLAILDQVDWLRDAAGMREQPPAQELRTQSCSSTGD